MGQKIITLLIGAFIVSNCETKIKMFEQKIQIDLNGNDKKDYFVYTYESNYIKPANVSIKLFVDNVHVFDYSSKDSIINSMFKDTSFVGGCVEESDCRRKYYSSIYPSILKEIKSLPFDILDKKHEEIFKVKLGKFFKETNKCGTSSCENQVSKVMNRINKGQMKYFNIPKSPVLLGKSYLYLNSINLIFEYQFE